MTNRPKCWRCSGKKIARPKALGRTFSRTIGKQESCAIGVDNARFSAGLFHGLKRFKMLWRQAFNHIGLVVIPMPRLAVKSVFEGFQKRFFHCDTTLSPIIEAIRVVMKKILQKVTGSLNTKIPTNTVPTAPIPVQTA